MGDGNGEMGMKGREWGGGNEGTGIGRYWETGILLYIQIMRLRCCRSRASVSAEIYVGRESCGGFR